MRIIFLASGAFALPTLRWLARSGHDVPLVVTQPARPSGRGRRTAPTPVCALADELGFETLETEDVNAPDVAAKLRSLDVRLGLVVAFGQKLGPDLLGAAPAGFINLHASLLPKYRGAAPINWAILRAEERTGCTVFRITERMDAGPVLTTRWTTIKLEETAGELHDRLAAIGVDAVDAALQLYEGNALPEGEPQNENEASHAPKLKKSDGFVRFDRPAAEVARHICGMAPWPGAAARFQAADGRWEKVNITRARRAGGPTSAAPVSKGGWPTFSKVGARFGGGNHAPTSEDVGHPAPTIPPGTIDDRCYVAARDGFVEILEIQPSSGRIMTWADYVNGRHVAAGDSFVTPDA